ncbi:MAG: D-tyrosyl-tRNA(Tyr) deacylase [Firmicutes bacterium]|nr:D-tyrosyl-tRNA(Tyr) deacylase [Bacillota bacterium]
MKALIQRVSEARVTVGDTVAGEIGPGFLVLLGVGHSDTEEAADYLARKTAAMRIFEDENDKMNLSLRDIGGSVLVVSQFTLYADCRKGNRPSFTDAGAPDRAEQLYEYFCAQLRKEGIENVQQGVFGAHMQIHLINDGPVTIMLEK